jgi:hypothetical protein
MCVIVAAKLPRNKKTGLPEKGAQWRLAKIRDRTYSPTYKLKRYTVNEVGASQIFLVDLDTDWTEGLSIHPDGSYMGMVNSALNNSSDKKDDGSKSSSEGSISVNGKAIRRALKLHNIEKAVELLKEYKFDGNTFLTDGDRLFIMETYLPAEVKDKYRSKIEGTNKRFEDVVPPEEYVVSTKEIKKDYLVVRANSGVLDPDGGYVEVDGDSYESSQKRREYTMKFIEESVYEPIELITKLSRLGRDDIDKNPFFRPIRLKGKAKSKDNPNVEIFSTSIIQLDPAGTMILKPIECKVEDVSVNKLVSGKYLANLVILPESSPMFENFRTFVLQK